MAFVIGHDAVARVGEPDGTVGMHREVVGGVELFALKSVYQHGDGPVVFGARHAARIMLASEQPALTVAVVAIAVVRGATEDTNFSRVLEPAQDAVVGDVAPEKIAAVAKPHGAFQPARAGVQAFDRRVADFVFCEARINYFDGGIGIDDGSFLLRFTGKG